MASEDPIGMTRIALLSLVLSACAGSSSYYPAGPVYASSSQTTQSADGSQTTTTTTTASFEPNEPAPAPAAPVAEPVAYEPPPPPAPPADTGDSECDRRDTPEMCVALHVILDIGDILREADSVSCRRATKELNRYADRHVREIRTLLNLEETETAPRLRQWQERHQQDAAVAISRALDMSSRCDDERADAALERVGFRGLIGRR